VYVDYEGKRTKNMLDKKRGNKTKIIPDLQKEITEICVGNGRASEPFIKVFKYSEENITKSSLGSLIGIFEVTEKSEDSTYIVNFLASVAKKEYFSNGRRGSIESFEASLHKINLALAELVKNGNIAWLGKFHGAIGILEKNNLHFSVAGDAKIFLIRSDSLSEISEGIASPESRVHPIKTFIEISSGRLLADDKIILTSPELCSLLTNEDIEKNAKRMDNEHFSQFLRTVLVNQVDIGGSLVVDLSEGAVAIEKPKETKKGVPDTTNVFSQDTFIPKKNDQGNQVEGNDTSSTTKKAPEEYTDEKTGHIFVQGETHVDTTHNPFFEKTQSILQESWYILRTFSLTQYKSFSKGRRKLFVFLGFFTEKIYFMMKQTFLALFRSIRRNLKRRYSSLPSASPKSISEKISENIPTQRVFRKINLTSVLKERIRSLHFSLSPRIPFLLVRFRDAIFSLLHTLFSRYEKRTILLGGIFFAFVLISCVSLFAFFFMKKAPDTVITVKEMPLIVPSFPTATEKNSSVLPDALTAIITIPDQILTALSVGNETYLATDTYLLNISNQKKFLLPAGNGTIKFVSVMDDLRLVFLYTSENKLFSFSPTNNTFTQNTLTLPSQTNIGGIGTYLTYLYVLDKTSNQIYRFPRADGGFGAPVSWLKDTTIFSRVPHMTISENVFVTQENTLSLFLRGRFVKNCELGTLPLSPTSLFTKPDFRFVYALDAENKRVLIWDQSGALLAQYFSEQFASGTSIMADEDSKTIFLTTDTSLLSFFLP